MTTITNVQIVWDVVLGCFVYQVLCNFFRLIMILIFGD